MGLQKIQYTPEELQKKREEAERKARRGEIEPTHDFAFTLISRFTGLHKLQILDFIFTDPTILDDLDFFYKSDHARKLLFYYQLEETLEDKEAQDALKKTKRSERSVAAMRAKYKPNHFKTGKKGLSVTDGTDSTLTGYCIYFLRAQTKRALGEETFQREIISGLINASKTESLLWNIERMVSNIFIPFLNSKILEQRGESETLRFKVRKDLLPCLRSFTSGLRVAEMVWKQGMLIKEYPPEVATIKNLDDSWALLKEEDGQARFEGYLGAWMKEIEDLLNESEQIRVETDESGPQDEIEYWKSRAAQLTLLTEQMMGKECKMTVVTLRAAKCKLLKVWHNHDVRVAGYFVEAVDNAKFLGAAEQYIHPIYLEDPIMMKAPLMRLLYTVKMIFNVSTYFNNSVRVSSLLVKITNQIIISCKRYITAGGRVTIWNQEREIVEKKLHECIDLNAFYIRSYHKIKDQDDGRDGKNFDFSQKYIFGKFNSFCIRMENLLSMFEQIGLFKELFQNRMEALLSEESVDEDKKNFEAMVSILKLRDYDFLDYRNTKFDIDFADFNRKICNLTEKVKNKLETTYDDIWDTPHSFQYLARFEKLSKALPIGSMDSKYKRMIATFKGEMERTARFFKRQQKRSPLPRNYPSSSGKILWVRSLLAHLKHFIDHFENEECLKSRKEYRKLVRQYNETGVTLMKFECEVEQNRRNPTIRQIEGMIAKPVLKEHLTGGIQLNFDPMLYNMLRENERLCKLDITLPSTNQFLIKRKSWFLEFRDMVSLMLENYHQAIHALAPDLKRLYGPHLNKIRACLEPGMAQINWTCHSWEEFTEKCINDVSIFKNLIDRANDIYVNRLEKLLDSLTDVELFSLPKGAPWPMERFVETIKVKCKAGYKELQKKSSMIEDAIEDLISLALEFKPVVDIMPDKTGVTENDDDEDDPRSKRRKKLKETMDEEEDDVPLAPIHVLTCLDKNQIAVVKTSAKDLRKNYSKKICEKLVLLMKTTLRALANHFKAASGNDSILTSSCKPEDKYTGGEIIFVLETFLSIPKIEVRPSVEELQKMLNTIGNTITSINKGVGQWKRLERRKKAADTDPAPVKKKLYDPVKVEIPLIEAQATNFYKQVMDTKDVIKSIQFLSKCMEGLKLELGPFRTIWKKYSEVWTIDREDYIVKMNERNPCLKEYEEALHKYKKIAEEVQLEKNEFRYGTLLLSTVSFKETLQDELKHWVNVLTKAVHQRYKRDMDNIIGILADLDKKLDRQIENLDDIRIIMETQKRIREIEIDLDMRIETVEHAFVLIAKFQFQLSKDEVDKVENLEGTWLDLQQKATRVQVMLLTVQEHFQRELVKNLKLFEEECRVFVEEYNTKGPMEDGLTPKQASDRLQMFQNMFETLWKKHSGYSVGEELFGLEHTEQPELNAIKKELNLLQRLYKLYNDVIDSVNSYYLVLWAEINVEEINNELIEFGNRCRKLPKALKEWPAFFALKKVIDDFNEICPLLEMMSNKAMKFRHWERIQGITKHTFDLESKDLALSHIMEAPLLTCKEDIEDVCISAQKEKDIEAKLRQVTSEWTLQELKFQVFKNRGELLLRGDTTAETVALAEDSLMILGSLLSNRYNAPFKKAIQKWVNDLSYTNEILERWLTVQNLWVYLEAVFVGGDIAKQLPKEAKRFNKIDRNWQKILGKAHDTPGVVNCCVGDENLKAMLPHMQSELELCQKSLTGYLEKKRLLFPRFFFVSDPSLLEILGQGSDSHTIQSHLLSIFDNIAAVRFHDQDYNKILSIVSSEKELVLLERPVRAEGSVESWLTSLLNYSQEALHGVIRSCYLFINDNQFSLLEMVSRFQAQVCILGIQMVWTRDAENALSSCRQDKKIMGETNTKFLDMLNLLIQQTTKNLEKVERKKYETMITIHMHQRDIFDVICRMNIKNIQDFEWLKQARFYFKIDMEKMIVSVTDVNFQYQNEYIGVQDRLVITPLTDRCYITLAQALGMSMGGAPAGPAGTGKTETVKDMAKTLGKYCVVFNCSDQMDFRGLGRIYKGLAQSGTWGCFDEFNRITLPVLSVAAQQINVVLTCKKEKRREFTFTDGDVVEMNTEFGIFITMNPTYAGRQELPENMKIQFRGVAMMVPDRQLIMRVKLASCGFIDNIILSRKFFTLYKLCEEQLSKQIHYDFGLRNILSVLRTLGTTKRENLNDTETVIVMRVLKDMNISKMVHEDEPIFLSLISDLFPNQKLDKATYPDLETSLEDKIKHDKLVTHPPWGMKLIQLYETQRVRHGIMVLGPSGAGKSCCIDVLQKALTLTGKPHREMRMNPKAITAGQMFGRLDVATNDWSDGIFSALWRKTMKGKKGDNYWIILDGPVDPNWIENLNSVLDDSKILTLANGDRLMLPTYVKLVFEPQDLDNASPATVSRCGMVYMSSDGLDWEPLLHSWVKKKELEEEHAAAVIKLFKAYFPVVYKWATTTLHFVMNVLQVHVLHTLFVLLEALLPCLQPEVEEEEVVETKPVIEEEEEEDKEEKGDPVKKADKQAVELPVEDQATDGEQGGDDEDEDEEEEEVTQKKKVFDFEQTFIFCLSWALGGYLEDDERVKLEEFMRTKTKLNMPDLVSQNRIEDSLFEFQLHPRSMKWTPWTDLLGSYVPPEVTPQNYGNLLIPNIGSIRTEFLIGCSAGLGKNVLLIGEQGSAKTTLIYSYLKKKDKSENVIANSNFSSSTTPYIFQKNVEACVDKRMGMTYGPPAGKKMALFVDDLNLPEVNEWGDQCTNEFFRAMVETGGFYNLEKPGDFTTLVDVSYMAAMNHPGGGRNDIPHRLKRHFITFNCTIPTEEAIDHIFGTIARGHFNSQRGFCPAVTELIEQLVPLTRQLWLSTKEKMLPTPQKFHYVFNMRDLSRIWLGMIGTQAAVISDSAALIHLWRHEISRVMADRFVNDADKKWFDNEMLSLIQKELGDELGSTARNVKYFVDFMQDAPEPTGEEEEEGSQETPKVYEAIDTFEPVVERLNSFLEQYNEILRGATMDLVFFPDAIINLIKISRIIRNPGGNMMLVGVGGSGKQSLTKLASFIAGYRTFQITLTRTYNSTNFSEDLKNLFRTTGVTGTGTTFLFTDQDIKEEAFLEPINNVLAGGLLSALFSREEQSEIIAELVPVMKREMPRMPPTPDNVMQW